MIENPSELKWIQGPLPPVESVPYDCCALAWLVSRGAHKFEEVPEHPKSYRYVPAPEFEGVLKRIIMVHPWKDSRNPLRWCDSFPIGHEEEVTWYAWVKQ